jgi:hypothetical protein
MIVIGIDPHKSSITAAAIDPSGCQLGVWRFVVNAGTARQLLDWPATSSIRPPKQADGRYRGATPELCFSELVLKQSRSTRGMNQVLRSQNPG